MGGRVNILLPIETTNRELDYKLFLAVMFASQQRDIYIGQHDVIHDRLMKLVSGGIYIGKHMFPGLFPGSDVSRQDQLLQQGFRIVHMDEEGAIYKGLDASEWDNCLERRLDINCLDASSKVCTWGSYQAKHYAAKRPEMSDRILATGNPRFDVYKEPYRGIFEPEAQKLRDRYGDFVLISGNFAAVNNTIGYEKVFAFRGWKGSLEEQHRYIEQWRYTSISFTEMVTLVYKLSYEFPELTFVVRPHPSEEWEFYKHAFAGVGNVAVVHQGPIGAWITASRAVIQDGCTAAVEAHIAGVRVINYKPLPESEHEGHLVNQFGLRCSSAEEVFAALRSEEQGCAKLSEFAQSWLANAGSKDGFVGVLEAMADLEAELPSEAGLRNASHKDLHRMGRVQILEETCRGLVRRLFPKKLRAYQSTLNKYRGLKDELVRPRLESVQSILSKRVRWKSYGTGLIRINAG